MRSPRRSGTLRPRHDSLPCNCSRPRKRATISTADFEHMIGRLYMEQLQCMLVCQCCFRAEHDLGLGEGWQYRVCGCPVCCNPARWRIALAPSITGDSGDNHSVSARLHLVFTAYDVSCRSYVVATASGASCGRGL